MKTKLYAKATSGKTKFLELEVAGDYLITRWGYIDGKQQETKELCEGKNTGKVNATTAHEQAVLEYERKIKKKTDEGYVDENIWIATIIGTPTSGALPTKQDEMPNFANLQKHFCPCKPIAKPPKDCLTGKYLADRKFNGVNLIWTRDADGKHHIYTRRIEDITDNIIWMPEFKWNMNKMPNNSMVLLEFTYLTNLSIEEPEQLRGLINSRRSLKDVKKHYDNIIQNGFIMPVIFDVMFWDNMFMGNTPFIERRKLLNREFIRFVALCNDFNQKEINSGKISNWEGFILRKKDGLLEYTMNGKAKRSGSWKWKFEETDDFIVRMAEKGKGKNAKYFARFNLIQYNKKGYIIDCGYCGPGKLKVAELEELYKERSDANGDYKIMPFLVVEVLYRTRTKDGKLEFPVLQRIRDDKKPEECIYG